MTQVMKDAAFPHWTDATSSDIEVITRQLGRRPEGVLKVAKRCRFGRPQVIVNAPVRFDRSGKARPFPTLFWLTCPYLVKAVGMLESEGWIGRMRLALDESKELAAAMVRAHEAHARLRAALCGEAAAAGLSPAERKVLETSGVGGARRLSGVKCLHAHLADYLGRRGGDSSNPVGRETAGLLLERGVDLDGRFECATCSHCPPGEDGPVAAIDVGSNAVRMLVARVEPGEPGGAGRLEAIDFAREATRLADALGPGGDGGAATLAAIERFADRARGQGARAILGVATAAVRDSAGAREFLVRAWERCGVSVRAISGREEAELAFTGAIRALGDGAAGALEPVTVVDVGGGSTEVVAGDWSGAVQWSASVPIGAVRLTREFPLAAEGLGGPIPGGAGSAEAESLPVGEAMYRAVRARLEAAGVPPRGGSSGERGGRLVAVGGAATSLAAMALKLPAYDPEAARGVRIRKEVVEELLFRLSSLPVTERLKVPGLEPDRADIIPAGLAILKAVMSLLGARELVVSDGGVMHGLIWSFSACRSRASARAGPP